MFILILLPACISAPVLIGWIVKLFLESVIQDQIYGCERIARLVDATGSQDCRCNDWVRPDPLVQTVPPLHAVADARERVTAELPGLLVRGDEKDGLFDAVKP